MSLRLKTQPDPSAHLCRRCRLGRVAENESGRISSTCSYGDSSRSKSIDFVVTQCSQFDNKSVPSVWDMEQLAWIITTNSTGKATGFKPPKKDD